MSVRADERLFAGAVVGFSPRQQRCPDCARTRQEERDTEGICNNRFHDRFPPWKGWTA